MLVVGGCGNIHWYSSQTQALVGLKAVIYYYLMFNDGTICKPNSFSNGNAKSKNIISQVTGHIEGIPLEVNKSCSL